MLPNESIPPSQLNKIQIYVDKCINPQSEEDWRVALTEPFSPLYKKVNQLINENIELKEAV